MTDLTEIRCPVCRRLLAKREDDGSYTVRLGDRYQVSVFAGRVSCSKCGLWFSLAPGHNVPVAEDPDRVW